MQPVCGAEVGPLGAWEALGRCGVWNGMDLRAGCGPSLGGAAKASNYATCVPTIHLEIKGQLPVLRHSCPHSHPQPLPGTGPHPGSPLPPRHQGCLSSLLRSLPWPVDRHQPPSQCCRLRPLQPTDRAMSRPWAAALRFLLRAEARLPPLGTHFPLLPEMPLQWSFGGRNATANALGLSPERATAQLAAGRLSPPRPVLSHAQGSVPG